MNGLRVTDGTATVVLTSGTCVVRHYVPLTPEKERVQANPYGLDGGEAPLSTYRNVTEPCAIAWVQNANARADIASLNRLFDQARAFQRTGLGSRVFVEFSPDGSESYWRSEILDADLTLDENALGWQFTGEVIHATATWLRRFFWEGPETQIPLSNGNGSGNTAGLTVWNHDDEGSGHDNWVEIAAADVTGDLPAPPRLELTNNYNNVARAATLFVCHNVSSGPGSLAHMLEAEDATTSGTLIDWPVGASGAAYVQIDVPGGNVETELFEWELSTSLLNACGSNYFRLVPRAMMSFDPDLWLRVRVKLLYTTIWEGPKRLLDPSTNLQGIGTVQLPPYLVGSGDLYPLQLTVSGTAATAKVLTLDFLQLSPLDGWRHLESKGYGVAYEARLVDDMMTGALYTDGYSAPGRVGNFIGYGQTINLRPGKLQRLYFLTRSDSGNAAIERTWSVKAFYRPRRLTL